MEDLFYGLKLHFFLYLLLMSHQGGGFHMSLTNLISASNSDWGECQNAGM